MTNDDMLQKIKYYMVQCRVASGFNRPCYLRLSDSCLFPQGHSNVKLQLAATFCVSNLIWNEEDGKRHGTRCAERRGCMISAARNDHVHH